MPLSMARKIGIRVACVIAICPVVGLVGLICCGWRDANLPEVYCHLLEVSTPKVFPFSMIAVFVIGIFVFVTAVPFYFRLRWTFWLEIVLASLSFVVTLLVGIGRLRHWTRQL